MKKINLAITGCLGRMGRQLIKSSKSDKKIKFYFLIKQVCQIRLIIKYGKL